jgi:hypothetical protein
VIEMPCVPATGGFPCLLRRNHDAAVNPPPREEGDEGKAERDREGPLTRVSGLSLCCGTGLLPIHPIPSLVVSLESAFPPFLLCCFTSRGPPANQGP